MKNDEICEKLNDMYSDLMNKKFAPIKVDVNNAATAIRSLDESFSIRNDSKIEKVMKIYRSFTNSLFIRVGIDENTASELISDYLFGIQYLSIIKNEMLTLAAKEYDLDHCNVVSFEYGGPSVFTGYLGEVHISLCIEKSQNDN